jgi:FkbM family methyltransferase
LGQGESRPQRTPMRNIYSLLKALLRIARLGVSRARKTRILASWFKVFVLKRYDSGQGMANLAGFKVSFCTYNALSFLFNEIFLEQEYFFVTENKTPYIVDCGSNIGLSVIYFKMMYPGSTILAFEPSEEAYACLEANVRNNRLDFVTLNKLALSNREGTIDFYCDPDDVGSPLMSTKQARLPKQKRTVQAALLSRYIDREVDFLKMDVEGAELEIMEELSRAGKLHYARQMVIEYHHHVARDSDVFSRLLRLLEEAGFGYQIGGYLGRPLRGRQVQDILVYAYQSARTPSGAGGPAGPASGSAATTAPHPASPAS